MDLGKLWVFFLTISDKKKKKKVKLFTWGHKYLPSFKEKTLIDLEQHVRAKTSSLVINKYCFYAQNFNLLI